MRILMVDDCPFYRFVLSTTLQAAGFIVDEAADGVEALEHLAEDAPDLIMTDINMPRMDGINFIEAARQTLNGSDVPVYIYSSDDDPAKIKRAAACGVEAWMFKPMDILEIATVLWEEAGKAASTHRAIKSADMRLMKAAA